MTPRRQQSRHAKPKRPAPPVTDEEILSQEPQIRKYMLCALEAANWQYDPIARCWTPPNQPPNPKRNLQRFRQLIGLPPDPA